MFIGSDLDKAAITAALDKCLLTPAENPQDTQGKSEDFKANGWKFGWRLPEGKEDPIPRWPDLQRQIDDLMGVDEEEEEEGEARGNKPRHPAGKHKH